VLIPVLLLSGVKILYWLLSGGATFQRSLSGVVTFQRSLSGVVTIPSVVAVQCALQYDYTFQVWNFSGWLLSNLLSGVFTFQVLFLSSVFTL
jgi:hypothetical protein